MKMILKLLSISALFIAITAIQASSVTIEEASDLLKRSGVVQAHYEEVNIALEDPKKAILCSNDIFKYGIPGFLSDISGLSHIDASGNVLKAMSLVFEKGDAYLPENADNTLKNQTQIVISVYQEILDTFCWGRTEGRDSTHALEVTSLEVAALYVARQRLKNIKATWENL